MPFYYHLGKIPPKRHTQFRKESGDLYYEQLFGTEGFHGFSSLLYHVHRPTMVKSVKEYRDLTPVPAVNKNITSRMLKGFNVAPKDDFLESREIVLFNNDLNIALAAPKKSMDSYLRVDRVIAAAEIGNVDAIHPGYGFLSENPDFADACAKAGIAKKRLKQMAEKRLKLCINLSWLKGSPEIL